jgi:tetratricopeptide (TPR) repeat protein
MNTNKDLTIEEVFKLAVKNHQEGKTDIAQEHYNQVLKINPNHSQALNNIGVISKGLGENQKAKECYEKVIEINPNHAIAHNNLGNIFKKLEENQKAKECYEKAIGIDPNYANAHNNLGNIFKDLGEYQKAKECYEKAIEIDPNYANAHNNLGVLFGDLGEHQKAKSCYEIAIEIDPNYANAHNNLGNIFKDLGEYQKAKDCFEKARMLEPDFINLVNSVDKGDWQNSKNILTKVCINKIINMKKYIDEFISLWCLYCNKLLREGDIKKFTQIFIKLLIMGERNHNLNRLIKFLFKTVDINTILKLVESNDKILIKVSYCQYRFENGDFLQSEKLAATNIQDTKSLIKNTETEDLGWLVVRRSLALCKNKNFARKTLNNLLAP